MRVLMAVAECGRDPEGLGVGDGSNLSAAVVLTVYRGDGKCNVLGQWETPGRRKAGRR